MTGPSPLWIPVVAVAGYWSMLDNSFALDDFAFVSRLNAGASISIPAMWRKVLFIRPLGELLFVIDHAIWGSWSPGYHLTNLALHIVNGYLVAAIVQRFWPSIAVLAACLFMVVPFSVEAVAWISGRFDLLMTTFSLAGVWLLVRNQPWVGGTAFGLAMLTKETGVIAPALAILVACTRRSLWIERLYVVAPTFVVTLLYMAFRLWWLGGIGGYGVGDRSWLIVNATNLAVLLLSPVSSKVVGALPIAGFLGFLWLAPWMGLLRATAWNLPLAIGLIVFLVAYLPTVFVPLSTHGVTWRFLYFPSVGLSVAAAWAASQIAWPRAGVAVTTTAAWLIVLHTNLIFWESSSQHIQRVAWGLQHHDTYHGRLGVVIPASFAGAYMSPELAPAMGRLYRSGVSVIGIAERDARRLPAELLPYLVAPDPRLCFPSIGRPVCPIALPAYWTHPAWTPPGTHP